MENQHRKIKGYRELNKEEIELMNAIKEQGVKLINLHAELQARLITDAEVKKAAAQQSKIHPTDEASDECIELRRFQAAEPLRWCAIGKTDIETGVMALVRAVAQPS